MGTARNSDYSVLPPECWVSIASFLSQRDKLQLGLVCKQLYQATRGHGSRLWDHLLIPFSSAGTLHSFAAFCRSCACSPRMLMLQHGEWQGEQEQPQWQEVVAAAQLVLPSLKRLMIKFDGDADAGDWLRGASGLEELSLYCSSLTLTGVLGGLTKLRDLSLESTDRPLELAPGAALPPSLTKLFAVESRLAQVPEAFTSLTRLESAYLSRNPLAPASLSHLAPLSNLRLLSLIGCWFERPPEQLSALTSLRGLYLDYNQFGMDSEAMLQEAFSTALTALTQLQALGLSHNMLDSWPTAVERLAPSLRVLYLESNPGLARLPPSAAAVLSRLRVLSIDCSVLFCNTGMFATSAARLEHLFVSGSGLMWHVLAGVVPADAVMEALAAMPSLKKLTFVVQTQREEVPSVEVAQLMLGLPRRCPHIETEALDSESFFGVTLTELDAMKAAEAAEAAAEEAAAMDAE